MSLCFFYSLCIEVEIEYCIDISPNLSSSHIKINSHYWVKYFIPGLDRLAVLLTRSEMEDLISMLRSLQGHADLSELETNELMALLEPLPDKVPMDPALKSKENKIKQSTPIAGKDDNSPLATMIAKRQVLSNRLSIAMNAAVKRSSSLTASTPSTPGIQLL